MVEKIRGVSIKGRCFPNGVQFDFFPEANNRLAIVYGKNGSGKSTISEGISLSLHPNDPSDLSGFLYDETHSPIPPVALSNSVFVFNEAYVDRNVKIDDDALGTIVLLGGQVDLQSEIDKYIQLEQDARTGLKNAQDEFEAYDKISNPISPKYHWERIRNTLKQTGGWAEVDSKIKNLRRNSSVTDEIIKEICALITNLTSVELQSKFAETKELFEKIKDAISYPIEVKPIIFCENIERDICTILSKQIEQPTLTEREKLILSAVQKGRQAQVEAALHDFSKSEISICPYCYQPVEEHYKKDLLDSINRVLNKNVDLHRDELESIVFPNISLDLEQFTSLNAALVQKISDHIKLCNKLIEQYRDSIQKKLGNLYTPILLVENGLVENIKLLNSLLSQLELERTAFNTAANRQRKLRDELLNLNKQIAHLQIAQEYKDYQKQVSAQKKQAKILEEKQKAFQAITSHLQELYLKKANIGLAIKSINNALNYVFFSQGRLSIELKNDKYYLKSNGQDVRPRNISLGERNVIALCYFFTQIMANEEISKLYEAEKLIVLDDPVSSFDFENKVGIISFLRYQINRIIKGNNCSKVLVLSHDLTTVFDLNKAMEEICKSTKGNAKVPATVYLPFELVNGSINRFTKSRSEYGELIKFVYHYANEDIEDTNIVVGNAMRRVLEAFSTFTYRKSIEDVSNDPGVLKVLNHHSMYFENLMYRLILHGESHFEEQIYSLHGNVNFYQFVSEDEKKRTAKDVLCFMYLLNDSHVVSYLQDTAHAIEKIKEWIKTLPSNSAFKIDENTGEAISKKVVKLFDLPISAGTGSNIFDEEISYEEYETENQNCDFALRVSGNSMEPTIPDGAIILIKKCKTLNDGKIGAFFFNGEVFCKQLCHENSSTYLVSLNPTYPPIKVMEADSLELYGEVLL